MGDGAWTFIRNTLIAVVVVGLAIDAWVHLYAAPSYDGIKTSALTQGDLFRIESGLAIAAALTLVIRTRRYTALFALVVTFGGLTAVLVYSHFDVGRIGIIPNMYEPYWFDDKTLSAWGEGIGAAAALPLFVMIHRQAKRLVVAASPVVSPTVASPTVASTAETPAALAETDLPRPGKHRDVARRGAFDDRQDGPIRGAGGSSAG